MQPALTNRRIKRPEQTIALELGNTATSSPFELGSRGLAADRPLVERVGQGPTIRPRLGWSGSRTSLAGWAIGIALLLTLAGCTPPRGTEEPAEQPAVETPQPKAPASTAYGKALEAADRLKSQAQDYNDRLEKLSDPTIK